MNKETIEFERELERSSDRFLYFSYGFWIAFTLVVGAVVIW